MCFSYLRVKEGKGIWIPDYIVLVINENPLGFTYEEMQMFHSISDLLGIQKSNPYCGVWIMNPNCV